MAEGMKVALKKLYVTSRRGGGHSNHQIIHVGDHDALGQYRVKWGDIYHKDE